MYQMTMAYDKRLLLAFAASVAWAALFGIYSLFLDLRGAIGKRPHVPKAFRKRLGYGSAFAGLWVFLSTGSGRLGDLLDKPLSILTFGAVGLALIWRITRKT